MIYDEINDWYNENDTYKEQQLGNRTFYLIDKNIFKRQIKKIDTIEEKTQELEQEKQKIEEYLR